MSEELAEVLTVVNRTLKPFAWMYDGREREVPALESKSFPRRIAMHARKKSIYGRDRTGNWLRKVGIKEMGDNCDPIEDADAPDQFADLMHRKDELAEAGLTLKTFSNPDLAAERPIS